MAKTISAEDARAVDERAGKSYFPLMLGVTALVTLATIQLIFLKAPIEATMGIIQKILYFHAPAAYSMYLAATVCFAASAGYLYNGKRAFDAVARAGAEVTVAMGFIVLITGPLWGAKAWGVYWTWDPRLTTSLLSVMLYVAYVLLRNFTGDGEAERKFAAALGVLGAANLPIIHYSVQKWGGNHPKVITSGGGGIKDADMRTALLFGFISFTLIAITLVWARAKLHLSAQRLADVEQEALELGVGEE